MTTALLDRLTRHCEIVGDRQRKLALQKPSLTPVNSHLQASMIAPGSRPLPKVNRDGKTPLRRTKKRHPSSATAFPPASACAVRQEQSAPLLADLKAWLGEEHSRLSRSASVVKTIDHLLKRWDRFACFLDDGRICLKQQRRRGFERGAEGAAAMATLIIRCFGLAG